MCQQGGQALNFCPLQTILWNRGDWPLQLRITEWQQGGPCFCFQATCNREKGNSNLKLWLNGKNIFPWKVDWIRRVVGYWLTKFSTLSLMKVNSAWKRTSTVPSPLLLLWGAQDLLSCSKAKQYVLENLAEDIENPPHHVPPLPPQATLTMSTMSHSIPWITLYHPCIEIITIQPLPLRPVASGENITQLAKREKNSLGTSAMRSRKEIRGVRMFQTAGLSLRWLFVVHQWAQTIKTLHFLGSKHQPLS